MLGERKGGSDAVVGNYLSSCLLLLLLVASGVHRATKLKLLYPMFLRFSRVRLEWLHIHQIGHNRMKW